MASPHSKAYSYEKRLEDILKARRIIDQSKGSCDLISDWLAIEAFQRDIPGYLKDEMIQAERMADHKHLPITVWREKYQPDTDALVIMRLSDFVDWFGDE